MGIEHSDCPDMFSEQYYRRTGWNLVNIPATEGSVLSHLHTAINGVNVPWLYIGMLFASFCWHNEDNYLYSINYSHFGATKQWYGVPGGEAKNFEKITKTFLAEAYKEAPDLLHHMTTQISPNVLIGRGLPVCKLSQEARTFVITFPKAFHCGFSYGFNCGEAVNFATPDWLKGGSEADERYRSFSRNSVFSHQRLLFTLLNHKSELPTDRALVDVFDEVKKVIEEELRMRATILSSGVRDISQLVQIPRNSFECIDARSCDYDDLRSCHVCKHICLLTAVACECDQQKVACVRHCNQACRCSKEKKYMLCEFFTLPLLFSGFKANPLTNPLLLFLPFPARRSVDGHHGAAVDSRRGGRGPLKVGSAAPSRDRFVVAVNSDVTGRFEEAHPCMTRLASNRDRGKCEEEKGKTAKINLERHRVAIYAHTI